MYMIGIIFNKKHNMTGRAVTALLVIVLSVGMLGGCSTKDNSGGDKRRLQIVTTIFPAYDWVINILGDKAGEADVTMLLDNGVDLHSFQPSAADILKISSCDLFIYVGGESDDWVKDALKEAINKNMTVINMLEVLGDAVKDEEIVEGMQPEDDEEEGQAGEEAEYDEHVWLSLKNAKSLVAKICEEMINTDPDNTEIYKANAEEYIGKLDELDGKYASELAKTSQDTVLFGDRFPFRYLTDDYGLKYYAAFAGCSAETEASFETIVFLAGKIDELGLKAIFTIERSSSKVAETIKNSTASKDQEILVLDSLQSVNSADIKAGMTYISVMESNLEVLLNALK